MLPMVGFLLRKEPILQRFSFWRRSGSFAKQKIPTSDDGCNFYSVKFNAVLWCLTKSLIPDFANSNIALNSSCENVTPSAVP